MPHLTRAARYVAALPTNHPIRALIRTIVQHQSAAWYQDPLTSDRWTVLDGGRHVDLYGPHLADALGSPNSPARNALWRAVGTECVAESSDSDGWRVYVRSDVSAVA